MICCLDFKNIIFEYKKRKCDLQTDRLTDRVIHRGAPLLKIRSPVKMNSITNLHLTGKLLHLFLNLKKKLQQTALDCMSIVECSIEKMYIVNNILHENSKIKMFVFAFN